MSASSVINHTATCYFGYRCTNDNKIVKEGQVVSMFVFELCKKNMLAASKTPVTIPPVTGFSKVYSTFESAKLGG